MKAEGKSLSSRAQDAHEQVREELPFVEMRRHAIVFAEFVFSVVMELPSPQSEGKLITLKS